LNLTKGFVDDSDIHESQSASSTQFRKWWNRAGHHSEDERKQHRRVDEQSDQQGPRTDAGVHLLLLRIFGRKDHLYLETIADIQDIDQILDLYGLVDLEKRRRVRLTFHRFTEG
jgi:hypothetical protein